MTHIKIFTNYVEPSAMQQIENLRGLPFIHPHVAIMPDVHSGKGCVVGSVIPTYKAIIPAAVGVDIGCGMIALKTNKKAHDLPDNLSQLRSDIEAVVPVGFNVRKKISSKLRDVEGWDRHELRGDIRGIFENYNINFTRHHANQLGTLGGGNHFIEVCLDEEDSVWVMLHSGSRGIGNMIGSVFIDKAKEEMLKWYIHLPDGDLAYLAEGSEHFDNYIKAMLWAQDYARLNREVMMDEIYNILGQYLPNLGMNEMAINCHHNYAQMENHGNKNVWVTRKGAVRAREGDLGIIPGSMGTKSYIVRGKGNKDSLCSCSHGAGRKMSRSEARRTFTVEDHIKATEGVECRKDEGVIDETPGSYKDIDEVMENQKDLVDIVHTLKAVLCIKG